MILLDSTTKVGKYNLFFLNSYVDSNFISFTTGAPGREFNKFGPWPVGIIPRIVTPAANANWAKYCALLCIKDDVLEPKFEIEKHYKSCQFTAVLVWKIMFYTYFVYFIYSHVFI